MAIDMITENISNLTMSPRISFSSDLHDQKSEAAKSEDYSYCSESSVVDHSSSDFDFCISYTDAETSSADELFSDGLIRPLQLRERFVNSKSFSTSRPQLSQPCLPPLPPIPPTGNTSESANQEKAKEIELMNAEAENKYQSRSFWRIKRSCSLHSDSSHKKSSFWSLPLLSRSNSTGSINKASKEGNKQNANSKQHKRLTATSSSSSSSSSSGASFYTYSLTQKPPVRKSYGGSYSNGGVRISPVLNVPPPCNIKGTANLFGFGSLFRNGKDNKSKK